MMKELAIHGKERYLADLARVQAQVNHELGIAAVHEERAKTEQETARVHRVMAEAFSKERAGILRRLEMPLNISNFSTDWDRGVYRFEEADNTGD
ncbi:MAG: hypothetical protein ACYSWU_27580 [Planctomycetota bacterium]|jgi:uncharacterized protein YlxP (DUF503 family)